MAMIFPNLIASLLRVKYRLFGSGHPIDVVDQLRKANHVLIYMPTKIEQFGAALKALTRLRQQKPDWKMTVLTGLEMVSFIDSQLQVDIVPYSNEDLNFLGMPKSSFKQLFQKSAFDLAIDFKLQFDPLSITIFQMSGAPIKVCMDSENKSPFYNLGIRVTSTESLTDQYNILVKYVTTISGSEIKESTSAIRK